MKVPTESCGKVQRRSRRKIQTVVLQQPAAGKRRSNGQQVLKIQGKDIDQRQDEDERTMVWKRLQTEEVTQRRGDAERIEAWGSPPTEGASQHRGTAKRTKAWKSPKTEEATQCQGEAGKAKA